jgi:hypothetical protein
MRKKKPLKKRTPSQYEFRMSPHWITRPMREAINAEMERTGLRESEWIRGIIGRALGLSSPYHPTLPPTRPLPETQGRREF